MLVRIITGIGGIGLAAFVIQAGGTLFAVCGLVLALGAWFEYCNAFDKKGYRPALVRTSKVPSASIASSSFRRFTRFWIVWKLVSMPPSQRSFTKYMSAFRASSLIAS